MKGRFRIVTSIAKGMLGCSILGLGLQLAAFYAPLPPSVHPVDRANIIEHRRRRFAEDTVLVVAATSLFGGLAGFATTWLARPRSFTRCLAIIVVTAGMARIATNPPAKSPAPWVESYSRLATAIGALIGCAAAMLPLSRMRPDS